MANILIARLEQEIRRQGYNYKTLSLAAGLGETSVRDIMTGRARNPRTDTLRKIARKLDRPLSYFLAEDAPGSVSVVGVIGKDDPSRPVRRSAPKGLREAAEGEIHYDTVEAPPEAGYRDLVAIRVRGDSLLPFLPDGTVIYYSEGPAKNYDECLGRLCVVQVKGGTTLLKILKPGTLYDRYTLEGYSGKAMENIEIDWCAKVLFIRQV